MNETQSVAIFLFAHQDDEFGVFEAISDEMHAGRTVLCAYLTDGGAYGVPAATRNFESLRVLARFGISEEQVLFAGDLLAISDGKLADRLDVAAVWIHHWVMSIKDVDVIYVPAWEGGHPDHDALHAILVELAARHRFLDRVRQFSLYNGYRCKGAWFKVFTPLPENGRVEVRKIPWRNRGKYLFHCMSYVSQLRSWVGLLPFVALHYLRFGTQSIQPASIERIQIRPHDGPLYYERRKFYTWEKMSENLSRWRFG
jgi:LmbE family N-acetylglucosaminyl deacetylase